MFYPCKPYYIITGRPAIDLEGTVHWIEKFDLKPDRIFHGNTDIDNPVHYKEHILRKHPEVTHYIESDSTQVDYLRTNVHGCTVLHFDEIVRQSIYG